MKVHPIPQLKLNIIQPLHVQGKDSNAPIFYVIHSFLRNQNVAFERGPAFIQD